MILKKSIKVRSEKRVEATVRLNSSLMSEVRLTVKLKMMMMRLFNFKGKPPHDNKFGFLFVLSLAKHYHRAEKSRVSLFFTSPTIFIIYKTRNQINDTFLFQNRVKVKVVGEVSEK